MSRSLHRRAATIWAIVSLAILAGPTPASVRADILLIAKGGANTVGQYDATTGAPIDANFITGITAPGRHDPGQQWSPFRD